MLVLFHIFKRTVVGGHLVFPYMLLTNGINVGCTVKLKTDVMFIYG